MYRLSAVRRLRGILDDEEVRPEEEPEEAGVWSASRGCSQHRLITLAGGSLGWQVLARRVFGRIFSLIAVVASPSPPRLRRAPSSRIAAAKKPSSRRAAVEPQRTAGAKPPLRLSRRHGD